MKIKIASMENEMKFEDNNIITLSIYENELFSKYSNAFYNEIMSNSSQEFMTLIKGDKKVLFSKKAFFIINLFELTVNERKIKNYIYETLEKSINNEVNKKDRIEKLYQSILQEIEEELYDYDLEYSMNSECDIKNLLKVFDIKLESGEQDTILQKFLKYVDIIETLNLAELIIVSNFKGYFSDSQLSEIYKILKYKKIKMLIIENNCDRNVLKNEKKVIIDQDYYDYYENYDNI